MRMKTYKISIKPAGCKPILISERAKRLLYQVNDWNDRYMSPHMCFEIEKHLPKSLLARWPKP